MRNIVLLHKLDTVKIKEVFVDIDSIIAVEKSSLPTFIVYLANGCKWEIDSNDYDKLMSIWASYYKNIV